MPYANNQGTKIYYEVAGEGPPLVLAHGGFGNLSMWTGFGYVDRLKEKYSVILFDCRGHGKSDKLYAPGSYTNRLLASDVIAVLDDLGIAETHYWGYSLNGLTGFVLAKYYPHRLLSLIIGGASPYGRDPDQPFKLLEVAQLGVNEGVDAAIEAMKVWAGGSISEGFEERLRNTDFRALVTLLVDKQHEPGGVEDVLPTMTMPCLIFIGERDEPDHTFSREYVKLMPNASRFVLPGLGHSQTMQAIDVLLPRVLDFLETNR